MEVWGDIPGFEGLYQVSNLGQVRSLHYGKTRILKTSPNNDGYLGLDLFKNGKRTCRRVHKIVAIVFVKNTDNLSEINHINGNKLDNRASNLEWCTRSHNLKHAFSSKLRTSKGEANARALLTETDVAEIRHRYEAGLATYRSLAREFGVSKSTIGAVICRETWS
jgi:hypothetical protein